LYVIFHTIIILNKHNFYAILLSYYRKYLDKVENLIFLFADAKVLELSPIYKKT